MFPTKFTLPLLLCIVATPAAADELHKGDETGSGESGEQPVHPDRPDRGPSRIVEGEVTTEWPATAALMDGSEPFCTGTLIEPNIVLTAGHCLEEGAPTEIYFGDGPGTAGTIVSVLGIRIHEDYGWDRDIGLVYLDGDVPGIEPVSVDDTPAEDLIGQEIIYVGYGSTEGTGGEGLKKEATATVTDIDGDVLVVNPENGSACWGDSGGPLYRFGEGTEPVVAGVVSFGYTDDCMDLGGNTRTDVYVDWIAGAISDGADPDWESGLPDDSDWDWDTGDWDTGGTDNEPPAAGDTGGGDEPRLGCSVASGAGFGWLLMMPALTLLRRRNS